MTLGRADRQGDLFDDAAGFCGETLPQNSIFVFLHEHRDRLFPDGLFADLFAGDRAAVGTAVGGRGGDGPAASGRLVGPGGGRPVHLRRPVAVRRGAGGWDGTARAGFAHTVLVDMRERLRRSARPDRIFEVALAAAREAGLLGRRRVLDSTPLYDAVATMDTVTLIRSAIRGLLKRPGPAWPGLTTGADLRRRLQQLGQAGHRLGRQGRPGGVGRLPGPRRVSRCLPSWPGERTWTSRSRRRCSFLATVLGQDLETGQDGVLRIARKVAADRVISTVDPQARHGHKTSHRGFDGYKGHIAVDPDSEIITATTVTAGNIGDAQPATS